MASNITSFRIGCGKYIQEPGALAKCGAEVKRLGSAPLCIGDDTTLAIAGGAVAASIREVCEKYEVIHHNGTCNDERAKELAAYAGENGFDVIVGIGGGVIMDFAKLCAHFAGLPVLCVPTSSATCAAYTPMSVRYTPDWRTVGTLHYDYEVDAVIVDTAILVSQPVRLLLAGVFDALAKFVEIKQRFDESAADCPLGLDWAYTLAKRSYAQLTERTERCIADMRENKITPDVENVIFTTIAVTGVISGIARGHNQCALAHKFYEKTRVLFPESARPYLHGEIVGVGLLLQNHFNGEEQSNAALLEVMKKYGMPSRISDVGITKSDGILEQYRELLSDCSAVNKADADEVVRLRESLFYLWSLD